ncbi:MAG: hypothetical protein KAY65_15470 [Planctomycetes bacterium]|nr:hypothetical protein [Planctomycetota bacterium]
MKRTTKQFIMAAIVLLSVTVLSFGVRQVRLSVHRVRNAASAPTVGDSASTSVTGASGQRSAGTHGDDGAGSEQDLYALDEQDHQDGNRDTFDGAADSQHAGDSDQAVASPDHSNAYEHSGKHADVVSMDKSFKGDYSNFKGSKKMLSKSVKGSPASAYEKVGATKNSEYWYGNGEYWYVNKHPDGTTTKIQLQEIDGQLQPVSEETVYPSQGGKAKSEAGQGK